MLVVLCDIQETGFFFVGGGWGWQDVGHKNM